MVTEMFTMLSVELDLELILLINTGKLYNLPVSLFIGLLLSFLSYLPTISRFPKTGWIIKQLGFGDAGFVYSLIDKNSLTMDFYDHKERKLHEIVIKPRHFIYNTTTPPNLDIEI